MFLMFDDKTEQLTENLGLNIMFQTAKMRNFKDNKVNTNRIVEIAGVPCVPIVLSKVNDYELLKEITKKLGDDLVKHTPFSDSEHTTFFSNEEEFNNHKDEIVDENEVK